MIPCNRRATSTADTSEMNESAASFMARIKAELQPVRARQRCGPEALRVRAMMEYTKSDPHEAEAVSNARADWHFGHTDDVPCERPPPKPKDTRKQSILPDCMSLERSSKAVRHASRYIVVLLNLENSPIVHS